MSFVNGSQSLVTVPATCPNPERTGILLEGLAADSWRYVYDALFEVTAKSKTARDQDSSRMMDIVMENRVFDLGYSHMWDQPAVQFVRDLLAAGSTDVASTLTRNEKIMTKTLDKIIKAYEKNG